MFKKARPQRAFCLWARVRTTNEGDNRVLLCDQGEMSLQAAANSWKHEAPGAVVISPRPSACSHPSKGLESSRWSADLERRIVEPG